MEQPGVLLVCPANPNCSARLSGLRECAKDEALYLGLKCSRSCSDKSGVGMGGPTMTVTGVRKGMRPKSRFASPRPVRRCEVGCCCVCVEACQTKGMKPLGQPR
eukprot:scaffold143_cov260-Pinguiococcus_pyrenoidosus.AAC.58